MATRVMEPCQSCTVRFSAVPDRAPKPLVQATKRWVPSLSRAKPEGYQAVGMKPSTLPLFKFTTATALLVASATKSVLPSFDSTRALGEEPKGRLGSRRRLKVRATVSEAVSISLTVSLLALAT